MDKLLQKIKSVKPQAFYPGILGQIERGNMASGVAKSVGTTGINLLGNLLPKNTKGLTGLAPSKIIKSPIDPNAPEDGGGIVYGEHSNEPKVVGSKKNPVLTSRTATNQSIENRQFINNNLATLDNANQQMALQQSQQPNQGGDPNQAGQSGQSGLTVKGTLDGSAKRENYRSSYGSDLSTDDNYYLQQLDSMAMRSDSASRVLMNQIKSKYNERQSKMQEINSRYQAGLETAGIAGGSARYTPQLFDEQIRSAQIASQEQLMKLDQEEMFALATAQQDMENKNWKFVKEKVDYIKNVRSAKQKALQDQLKLEWEMEKFYKTQELKRQIESSKIQLGYDRLNSKGSGGGRSGGRGGSGGGYKVLTGPQKKDAINRAISEIRDNGGYLDNEGYLTADSFNNLKDNFESIGIFEQDWVPLMSQSGILPSGSKARNKRQARNYNTQASYLAPKK